MSAANYSTGGVLTAAIMFSLGALGFVLYVNKVGVDNLPLIVAVSGSSIDVAVARSQTGAELDGLRWFQLLMNDFLLIGSVGLVLWVSKFSPNYFAKTGFTILTFISVAAVFVTIAEKAKFVDVVLAFFLASLLWSGSRIPVLKSIAPAFLTMAALISMYWFFMGDQTVSQAISGAVSRAFTGQLQTGYHHLEYSEHLGQLLWGASFPNPRGILPFEPINYTQELMFWVHGRDSLDFQHEITGSMPTLFWGELYVNFGVVGVVFGSVLTGATLAIVDILAYPRLRSAMTISFYVWLGIHYKDLSATGLSQFIFDVKLLGVLAFLAFVAILKAMTNGIRRGEQSGLAKPSSIFNTEKNLQVR